MKENLLMRVAHICVLSLLVATVNEANSQSKVGTTAAQFLGIGVGPKAIAMGGAYVASNRDASLLYWNPGAFAQAPNSEVSFSNTNWLVGTTFRWAGIMLNLDDENAVGLSLTQLDYGEEEITTIANPNGTGEKWSANDMAVALSYSRRLTDRFSLGGSAKYIHQSIWNETASTFAFDLGLLFVTNFNDLRLGVSMSNFGGKMTLDGRDLLQKVDIDPANSGSNKDLVGKLKTDAWAIPLLFRVGVAMDVMKTSEGIQLTLAADAIRPSDNVETINLGSEVSWNESVFLRGGYKSLFGEDSEEGLTLGAGLKYRAEGVGAFELNYSYQKFGMLGDLNSVSVTVGF